MGEDDPRHELDKTTAFRMQAMQLRQIEIVATGLPLFHGFPLACDSTMYSPLRSDGTSWARADAMDGVAIARAQDERDLSFTPSSSQQVVVANGGAGYYKLEPSSDA